MPIFTFKSSNYGIKSKFLETNDSTINVKMADLSKSNSMTSSAFSPFAEYSSIKKPSKTTTFYSTRHERSTVNDNNNKRVPVTPVELIHSSDSVQALPINPNGAFRPIKVSLIF